MAYEGMAAPPGRAPWITVVQATVAFAAAGAVIAGYGVVLQPAWFEGQVAVPEAEAVLARMSAGTLLGGALGLGVGLLRRGVPGPWSLYGTLSGVLLAAVVNVEVVANPRFPGPWWPAPDGRVSLTGDQVSTLASAVEWMARGGWLALAVGLLFGLLVALWQDAEQRTPHDPTSPQSAGW